MKRRHIIWSQRSEPRRLWRRVSVNGGQISQVPIPAAGILLLGALADLGALRRRKNTQGLKLIC
ncbi:VPLPA-CTERM sorting domain-containing protein [Sulfitobacter sp.]|uniref:VPLPA-CTERM sorting domain-containing protein n=1 Tax=Sulfitobacter sp. TaxID=1903071 RepID=UPI003EF6EB5E